MNKWKKRGLMLLTMITALVLLTTLTGTNYVYKALLYNFADLDDHKLFPFREVPAGKHQPWQKAAQYNHRPLSDRLQQKLEALHSIAFVVIHNGELLQEHYWLGAGPDSRTNSFSVAKSVVGLLTGVAIAEGKIKSIDQPVADFLPSFKTGGKHKITIRHLLSMSSGLDWEENYYIPVSHTTEAYYGANLPKLITKLKLEKEPGTEFRYKSGDSQILSLVLEKATGQSLSEYASEKLWQPIGASQSAWWSLDQEGGHEKAYCCLNTNALDFARIGQLALNKGKWNEQQLVPASYIQQATSPIWLKNIYGEAVQYYGFQWWLLKHQDLDAFYARGILGQYVIVIPSLETVIVRLGHDRDEMVNHHPNEVRLMIEEVAKMVQSEVAAS